MDRNLEKNLKKIQGLRAKGQLEKALKHLTDWARKNPDTPHYQYEAAMMAFDLEDYPVGLNWLKALLRAAPDTRERVLEACAERFSSAPALPLGEFLVDRHLSERRIHEAMDVVRLLSPEQLQIYHKKTQMRHQSLLTTPSTPEDLLRSSFYTLVAIARARGDRDTFTDLVKEMVEWIPQDAATLADIADQELENNQREPMLQLAAARAHFASGGIGRGCELVMRAVDRNRSHAVNAYEMTSSLKPNDDDKATWLRTVAELALLSGRGQIAADHFREAADTEPKMRSSILERLAQLPDADLENEEIAPLLKLRLRLMVVLRQYKGVPGLTERLRRDGLADADEMRTLMGEGKSGAASERPTELLVLLAENALRAKDLRAAATHAKEIPDIDDHSLHKVIRTIESVVGDWKDGDRLELLALQAVLYSRVGDHNGANGTLVSLWEEEDESDSADLDTLFAITETCLGNIHPSPSLLIKILPRSIERDRNDLPNTALDGVLRHSPDDVKWLVDDLIIYLDSHKEHATALLAMLDSCDKDLGGAQQLRHPVACAALIAGEIERAIPEFQILLMAKPQMAEEVLDRLRDALKTYPDDLALNLGAYDLLIEDSSYAEAGECLSQALQADPARIEDLSGRFEKLLEKAPESVQLWMAYANALFAVGRYAQLNQLCEKAATKLPAEDVANFKLLQARILIEDGHVKEAVDSLDELMQSGHVSLDRAIETLKEMAATDPTNARAQLLLGSACAQAGQIDDAVPALCGAAKADRGLIGEVAQSLDQVAASPAVKAEHLCMIAAFHRRRGDTAEAARSYERSLRLDESLADRILGELTRELEDPHGDPALLFVGARAAQRASRLEMCCNLLTRIYSTDTDQFSVVMAELRKAAEAHVAELLPPRTMARIMLANKSPEAAAEVIAVLGQNEDYPLSGRIDTLREFHQRIPDQATLTTTLAGLLGQHGSLNEAADLLQKALGGEDLDATAALRICESLCEAAPEHGGLRLIRHDLLLRLGNTEDALATLPEPDALPKERQVELSRRLSAAGHRALARPELALRLAESLRRQGDVEGSLDALREAAEVAKGEAELLLKSELARALERTGRSEEAARVLSQLGDGGLEWAQLYAMVENWDQQRFEREISALRTRLEQNSDDLEARLRLAERLLERELVDDALRVLDGVQPEGVDAARRACLLAHAYLDRHQATRAEAILRAAEGQAGPSTEWYEEIRYWLAVCAETLGRHADAFVRYQDLIHSVRFGERARERASKNYGRYLSDTAGEYRAVISRISSL